MEIYTCSIKILCHYALLALKRKLKNKKLEYSNCLWGLFEVPFLFYLIDVNVSNETNILQFNQDGAQFVISTHNNINGKVEGNEVYFEGDVLTGAGKGGKQFFSGNLSGNTITGSFNGTVMTQFPGQNAAELGTVHNGTFILTKRTK